MTLVEFHFVLPTGDPFANSTVEILLAASSFSNARDGIAMPRPMEVQTDADGKVTVGLWPGTTMYYVSVQDTSSEAGLSYKFMVPEVAPGTVLRLQDIVIDAPMSGTFYDDAALLVIQSAKANSRASELAALASAASAAASLAVMGTHDATILAAKDAAALSAFNADASADSAAASAVAAAAALAVLEAAIRPTYRGAMASEIAMFALTAPIIGDKVKRTDLNGQVFEVIAVPITVLDNWLAYGGGSTSGDEYAGGDGTTVGQYPNEYAEDYAEDYA